MNNTENPDYLDRVAMVLKELDGLRVYRGQHGPVIDSVIQSRNPSITFSDLSSALVYATHPNDSRDKVIDSRVVVANLSIRNPVPTDIVSPFIDAQEILSIMGAEAGKRLLVKLGHHIEGTGNWVENFSNEYCNVADVVQRAPWRICDLYLNAYPVLDDASFVNAAKVAGYDGAIGYGNGETAEVFEYRIFSVNQADVIGVLDEAEARSLLESQARACAAW